MLDKASDHIDGPMKAMWNKTFVEMFGKMAESVTVGQLIRMQSGIGDFDVPEFDH